MTTPTKRTTGLSGLVRAALTYWKREEMRPCRGVFYEVKEHYKENRTEYVACCLTAAAFHALDRPGTLTRAGRNVVFSDLMGRFDLDFEAVRSLAAGYDGTPPDPDFTDPAAYRLGRWVADKVFKPAPTRPEPADTHPCR